MRIGFKTFLASTALASMASAAFGAETVSLQTLKNNQKSASAVIDAIKLGQKGSLQLIDQKISKNGIKLQKLAQFFDGIPVVGHTAIIGTDKNGHINRLHGYLAKGIEADVKSTNAKLTETEAANLAQQAHKSLYRRSAKKLSDSWSYRDLSSNKAIFIDKNGKANLVFNVTFFAEHTTALNPSRPNIMIDAITGKVISYRDSLAFAESRVVDATGPGGNEKTGQYQYGDDYGPLKVTTNDGSTCHFSTENVKTIDLRNEGTGNPNQDTGMNTTPHSFACSENTDRPINGAFSPLNDAHFFGTGVFSMYQAWYGINPLKTDLTLRVHYGQEFENAFWDGKQMTFGDGKDFFYPLVVLDVTAHEVSHGFTEFNSNLQYGSQSGGINESFSDIAGEAAENYMRGSNDFLVGGEIAKEREALRYFDDPTRDNISIKHVRDFREPTDELQCLFCRIGGGGASCAQFCGTDVHHSSGIYNKVFYEVSNSEGWTVRKAFDVFVKANQSYWSQQTNFQDGAAGIIDAANDLGYSTVEFKRAFADAGINL